MGCGGSHDKPNLGAIKQLLVCLHDLDTVTTCDVVISHELAIITPSFSPKWNSFLLTDRVTFLPREDKFTRIASIPVLPTCPAVPMTLVDNTITNQLPGCFATNNRCELVVQFNGPATTGCCKLIGHW